jgi:NAD(P)-dependent dehydrogenase (short-subunit alcohol dehydrogenase family)
MSEPAYDEASAFAGRVAAVSGGAGDIGRAVADALSARGARVALLDLPAALERAHDVGAEARIACDVTASDEVAAAFARVAEALGPVELLVCTAGVVSEAPVAELAEAEWDRVLAINLKGTFLCCQAGVRHMLANGRGRIVTYASGFGQKGYRDGAHYAASKAGVMALTKSLALEVAERGITANALAPGPIETAFLAQYGDAAAVRERFANTARLIPMGRLGTPRDLVGLTLFLLSPASAYITGQVFHVNGGMLMP